MAQADIDLAALTVAATRAAKILGFNATQAMATVSDHTGVSAGLLSLLTFLDTVTVPHSQSQKAATVEGI
jgi:hypothetical protein